MRQIRGIFINSFISHLLFIQQFSKVPTVATKENTSEEEALRKKKMNGSISRADSQRDNKKKPENRLRNQTDEEEKEDDNVKKEKKKRRNSMACDSYCELQFVPPRRHSKVYYILVYYSCNR